MKNRILLLVTVVFSIALVQTSNADIIPIVNLDPDNFTSGDFTSTVSTTGNTVTLSYTNGGATDLDSGGTNDTLSFDLVYDFYTGSTYSGTSPTVTTTLGTAVTPTSSGQNWGANTFSADNTLSLMVQNIIYIDGEADGNVAVFDGFTAIRQVNLGAGSQDVAVGGALTGQTIVATPANSTDIDLSSLGNSTKLFITSDTGNANLRLRDLDLQFTTIPEPSTMSIFGLAVTGLFARRRRV